MFNVQWKLNYIVPSPKRNLTQTKKVCINELITFCGHNNLNVDLKCLTGVSAQHFIVRVYNQLLFLSSIKRRDSNMSI